jgi:hypothetical protein
MLNFERPCEVPSRRLGNTTSSRPARSCPGPFDGGDDALGEATGEGDREIKRCWPRSASRWRRRTTIAPQNHSASRYWRTSTPAHDKAIMAVITTGKTNLALPSMRLSEPLH